MSLADSVNNARKSTSRRVRAGMMALCAAAAMAGLLACWIVPYRMYSGAGHYGFAYVSDEITYAYRAQPLIPGTTAANPVNGIGDANILSPFFLEDACRATLAVTGMDVVSAFWLWRVAFPLALGLTGALLAAACFTRRRPWTRGLIMSFAALSVPAIYALYHAFRNSPPLHGWLERIPSNIEYPLSMLLLAAFVRLVDQPTARNGVLLAAASLLLVYLRPYAAIPFVFMLGIGVGILLFTRRAKLRDCLPAACALGIGIAPWVAINHWNSLSDAYREMVDRYFFVEAYRLHDRWMFFAGLGVTLLLASRCVAPHRRLIHYAAAAGLLALIFVCGLPRIASELLSDRFGCFYIPIVIAAAAMSLERYLSMKRGAVAQRRATRASLAACGCALTAAAYVGAMNLQCDFTQWPNGPYALCIKERDYIPGYTWIRERTPPEALVLVDDGIDWTKAPQDPGALQAFSSALKLTSLDDLFQVVAKRRRVHHMRLYGNVISTRDLLALGMLHRGTFGRVVDVTGYTATLMYFAPQYVFWKKKEAPVDRTQNDILRKYARKAYEDEACEIWELTLPVPVPVPVRQ